MTTIDPQKIRNNMKLVLDEQLWQVVTFDHVARGKVRSFVVAKLRNLQDGRVIEKTFKGSESPVLADFQQKKAQYLYSDDMGHHFMNLDTYDQYTLSEDAMGDAGKFILPETEVLVAFWEDKPVTVELPAKMVFEVTDTIDDIARGNTANAVTKEATLETGYKLQVPPFIKKGQKIRVSTETGDYVERA